MNISGLIEFNSLLELHCSVTSKVLLKVILNVVQSTILNISQPNESISFIPTAGAVLNCGGIVITIVGGCGGNTFATKTH